MVSSNLKENNSHNFGLSLEDEEKYLIDYENLRTISWENEDFPSVFRDVVRRRPNESFYFLNESELKKRVEIFHQYFDRENDFVAYAIKANPLPKILEVLNSSGIKSFDCASIGEVIRVQELCENSEIFFNNPSKRKGEIESSYEKGIRHFTVDTENEVKKIINKVGSNNDLELAVRINTEIEKDSAAVIPLFDKFGADEATGQDILNQIINDTNHDVGVSIHVGSQNLKSNNHVEHIKHLAEKIKYLSKDIKTFNLGGGMPVFSDVPISDNRVVLNKYLYDLKKAIDDDVLPIFSPDLKVILEPGRSLVAPTVDLVVAINDVFQKKDGKKILRIDDGVFTSFSDYALHNWEYPFRVLDKNGKEVQGRLVEHSLEGRSCDSCDVIDGVLLPENISEDDYLWIPNAGAYHSAQSTFFNGMKPHKYVRYS